MPTISWPLPTTLQFQDTVDASSGLKVELRLLDGQIVRGKLLAGEEPSSATTLKLRYRDCDLFFAITDIRELACQDLLVPVAAVQHLPEAVSTPEHEEPLCVHARFVDGQTFDLQTLGYLNRHAGGLYLYLKQDATHYKALWIPRHALQGIRLTPAQVTPSPAAEPQRALHDTVIALVHAPLPRLASNMSELALMLDEARGKPMVTAARALLELELIEETTFLELQSDKSGKLRAYIDEHLAKTPGFKLQLEHVRAHMVKTPEVDAETFDVQAQALGKLNWKVANQQSVLPLGLINGTLYLASSEPMSRELEDRLNMIVGSHLVLVWASAGQIQARLQRELQQQAPLPPSIPATIFAHAGAVEFSNQDLQTLLISAQNEIQIDGAQVHSNAVDERSSVVRLVKRIIVDANQRKASDIHIETNPGSELSRVRFRIDGDLEEYVKLPADLRAALVSRIKVMSKLDISERRRPQDGKINFADFSDTKLELRVAIVPTHDNLEDVVLRLLASSKPIPLSQLGFSERDAKIVSRLAQRPYGMILACGPTGSGKTTTLHSLLSEINTENRKIWTAEDPIEITQAGLRQLQVNPKIGVTFASAMRAFLRADPDVIMIGEIRDEETARIAVEASLTGHLVLSTLHTNNAAESIVRLLDLGMDPMNFADSLVGIVAQRLVRALCKRCKLVQPLSGQDFERLVDDYVEGTDISDDEARRRLLVAAQTPDASAVSLWRSVGCPQCGEKGYKGRMGIYETLENSPELKQLIQKRAPTSQIFSQAIASGTRSLKQDALEKVFAGVIDLPQATSIYG